MTDLKDLKELAEAARDRDDLYEFDEGTKETRANVAALTAQAAFSNAMSPKTVLELIARVEAADVHTRLWKVLSRKPLGTTAVEKTREANQLRTALEQAKAREAELRSALERIAEAGNYGVNHPGDALLECENIARNAVTAMGGDDNG